MRPLLSIVLLAGSALLAIDTAAAAVQADQAAKVERSWEVELTPFLWVAGLNGEVGLGDTLEPVELGFVDILENLKGTAMADISLRYRRVGIVADGVWLRIGSTQASRVPTVDTVELTLGSAFGTGAAFFRFEPLEGLYVDPYVGARWWRIDTEVDIEGSFGGSPFRAEKTISWADPIFGVRVRYDITDRWFVRGIGDVGGGVSKYQWEFQGSAGFRLTDWLSLDAGYRINGVKYEKDGFTFDMNVSGFVMGVGLRY